MPFVTFLKKLGAGLLALGARRLLALGLAGLTVFVLVGVSGYYLSRPQREVLYANLDAQDVTRIGAALDDAGIAFDVSSTGDTVLVDYGETARARMILARRGLPKSDSAGYELFDKLGSLGLTSFMQQVTQVRALEGELSRTIQLIDGVKAARVHLAMRSDGYLRDASEKPTASVVIRFEGSESTAAAQAVRHLVAAAIPGLTPDQVTVMSTNGLLLSASDDPASAAPQKMIEMERTISSDLQQKLERTLAPYLGLDNFRVSVMAKLNADRRQINETSFDPNSRVERSVRTIKESGEAQNANGAPPATVAQNVPQEATPGQGGDSSREKKDHKEELTNYEINSKQTATTSEGYGIDQLSVAVVLNKAQLAKSLGANPSADAVTAALRDIEQLASSAAGLRDARGDRIKVTAVDFLPAGEALAPVEGRGLLARLQDEMGTFVNAGALLIVTLLVLLLGLRPALKSIVALAPPAAVEMAAALPGAAPDAGFATMPPLADGPGEMGGFGMAKIPGFDDSGDPQFDALARSISHSPRERLAKIVELDPNRAAQVLKQWLETDGKPAA